jgi:hypothetical protein
MQIEKVSIIAIAQKIEATGSTSSRWCYVYLKKAASWRPNMPDPFN